MQKELDNIQGLVTQLVANNVGINQQNELFKAALDVGISYITDIESSIILFASKGLKEQFGKNIEGQLCYKALHNKDRICENCTNPIILKQINKPHRWSNYNAKANEVYVLEDVCIVLEGSNNKIHVRLERAIEITDIIKKQIDVAWTMKQKTS